MAVPLASLQALQSLFTSSRVGPQQTQPGSATRFRVHPEILDLRVIDIVPSPLQFTWISKDVRFDDPLTDGVLSNIPFQAPALDISILGRLLSTPQIASISQSLIGKDIAQALVQQPPVGGGALVLTQQIDTTTNKDLTQGQVSLGPDEAKFQGVPGKLFQLAGNIPIPIEVPVTVVVQWAVLDSAGNPVGGASYAADPSLTALDLSITFVPAVVELTSLATPPLTRFQVQATLTISAGGTALPPFSLPAIPVDVPAIAIPTVVAFFRHSHFAARSGDSPGFVLIVVPNGSPLGNASQVTSVLTTLRNQLNNLTSVASFASLLLGVGELINAISAQPHVTFRKADSNDSIRNLNDITMIQNGMFTNDIEAEDEISSMIVVGPNGRRVSCFGARRKTHGEGFFTVVVSARLHATVRSLSAANPTSGPVGGELIVGSPAENGTFNDMISSMEIR